MCSPVTGQQKGLMIAVYDFDQYSADDFMGMVYIPIHDLQNDIFYDGWFPLKVTPLTRLDATL